MRFDEPNCLRHREIHEGGRWIYSAGFNVAPELRSTGRIDTELTDLRRILEAGGRVAILSHQGSLRDGTVRDLGFVADYLTERLGRPVDYLPENDSPSAIRHARTLRPGCAALYGNTRKHPGETRNDLALAERFAGLGDAVAVGGFSKAHRAHASNVGILRFLPGYLADSMLAQIELLAPWAGASDRFSVAVVGGLKREKTLIGLDSFTSTYDVVVPGGAVLNTLARALGHDVGSSDLGEDPEATLRVAETVLARTNRAELHIPDEVVIARQRDGGFGDPLVVPLRDGVRDPWAIVDFLPQPWLKDRLDRLAAEGGRAFMAGTPCLYQRGFQGAANDLLAAFAAPDVDALLLGGDTVAELPWDGPSSTGGGAALHLLAHGGCPVLDAVRAGPAHQREAER
jgi:phosphoglycerate kinase